MMDYEGPFAIEGRHVPLNPEGVVTSVAEGEGAGTRCVGTKRSACAPQPSAGGEKRKRPLSLEGVVTSVAEGEGAGTRCLP